MGNDSIKATEMVLNYLFEGTSLTDESMEYSVFRSSSFIAFVELLESGSILPSVSCWLTSSILEEGKSAIEI